MFTPAMNRQSFSENRTLVILNTLNNNNNDEELEVQINIIGIVRIRFLAALGSVFRWLRIGRLKIKSFRIVHLYIRVYSCSFHFLVENSFCKVVDVDFVPQRSISSVIFR